MCRRILNARLRNTAVMEHTEQHKDLGPVSI